MGELIRTVGEWFIGLVATGVGFWLAIWGIIDIGSGLGGKNKEWGKFLLGLGIGIFGGFLIVVGGLKILALFKSNGQEIPLK